MNEINENAMSAVLTQFEMIIHLTQKHTIIEIRNHKENLIKWLKYMRCFYLANPSPNFSTKACRGGNLIM